MGEKEVSLDELKKIVKERGITLAPDAKPRAISAYGTILGIHGLTATEVFYEIYKRLKPELAEALLDGFAISAAHAELGNFEPALAPYSDEEVALLEAQRSALMVYLRGTILRRKEVGL